MSKKVSIVIPVFNEEHGLRSLHEKLAAAVAKEPYEFELIFVDDGSRDGSLGVLRGLKDARVVILELSRNFGQHPALTAGIDEASGDAVVLMDADFEDSPEAVSRLLRAWEDGHEVVYAIRGERKVGPLKRLLFAVYHRLNSCLEQNMPSAGTFSLMDRRVVDVLKSMKEHNRYIPGLRSWPGFKQTGVVIDRGARYDGRPRVGMRGLIRLALNSFVGFSKVPLKLVTGLGLSFAAVGLLAAISILIMKLTIGFDLRGWTSLILAVLITSGIQLVCLGVLGEYIAQILDEVKARPLYLVRSKTRTHS